MKRKDFLSSVIPLGALFTDIISGKKNINEPGVTVKIPPYLKKGDTIGICAVAGYITLEDTQPCINKLTEWGFQVKIGNTIGKRDFTFGGTDEERLKDFQQLLKKI